MIPLGVLASAYVAPAGGGGELSYIGSVNSGTTFLLTSYTFAAVPLGAAEDRTVWVVMGSRISTAAPTTSVTIAGYAATIDLAHTSGVVTVARAVLPSSVTSGDVTLTHPSNQGPSAIFVYTYPGTVTVTDSDQAYNAFNTSAISTGVTLDTSAGGFALAALGARYTSGTTGWTWTGVTEDEDVAVSTLLASSGHSDTTGASLSISATTPAAATTAGIAAVTYAPA